MFLESEAGTADDQSDKAKKKNGIVPNLVTIPSSYNHPISAESMIDEVAEHEEQPDEIVEQGSNLVIIPSKWSTQKKNNLNL